MGLSTKIKSLVNQGLRPLNIGNAKSQVIFDQIQRDAETFRVSLQSEPRFRICLVTSGNLASNPRLVKEASALQESGYFVRVIAADIIPSLSRFDDGLIQKLQLECVKVCWRRSFCMRLFRALRQRAFRFVAGFLPDVPLRIAVQAHHGLTPALTQATSAIPADLYIAHNLAALPAAAAAAEKHGGKLGFDAEDYHCGELPNTSGNALELRIRRKIESALLPRCHHLTSASPQIGEAYAADYGIKMRAILNVFSLAEAPDQPDSVPRTRDDFPTLYWFSQTIGPKRGLEQIVSAMAALRTKVNLVLRGQPSADYINQLLAHARMRGGDDLASRVQFLGVAPPDQMVRLASIHDIGLAVEVSETVNRDICLTNKAFTYLLAGVPVLLSRTRAQCELSRELGVAGLLFDIDDPERVAEGLNAYFADREWQKRARAEAWHLGRERFNWETEQVKFLAAIRETLEQVVPTRCAS